MDGVRQDILLVGRVVNRLVAVGRVGTSVGVGNFTNGAGLELNTWLGAFERQFMAAAAAAAAAGFDTGGHPHRILLKLR